MKKTYFKEFNITIYKHKDPYITMMLNLVSAVKTLMEDRRFTTID